MLRSDLCDLTDAYIVMNGTIIVKSPNNDVYDKKIAFNAPFVSSISKVNNPFIENAEDLYVVMPMYNLLVYSKSYSKTTGGFQRFKIF